MAKCRAKTASGKPCQAQARKGGAFCFTHDPASGQARALARKRGGERNRTQHGGDSNGLPKQIKTLDDLRAVYDYTLAELLPMENSIPRARLLLAFIDSGLRLFEVGELEQRLTELEKSVYKQ